MRAIPSLPRHVIALANFAARFGKKAVVATAVSNLVDLGNVQVRVALDDIRRARSWRDAEIPLSRLGLAGHVLRTPEATGLTLPRLPCSTAHWGLPNVQAVAARLLA